MKIPIVAGVVAAIALLSPNAQATAIKKHPRVHPAPVLQPLPPPHPFNDDRGNAALGGNSANSAYGPNSAGENANGRTGGGFGGN